MQRKLDSNAISLITSGQVISSIPMCIKELVENSLDSEATSISIKLINNGINEITVSDNGKGIDTFSIESIGNRNFTSKLRNFNELNEVQSKSLGFRGEALNSLIKLSDKLILISSTDGIIGSKIEWVKGIKENISKFPRERGTSVTVINLLSTIPVRRRRLYATKYKILSELNYLIFSYIWVMPYLGFHLFLNDQNQNFLNIKEDSNRTVEKAVSEIFLADLEDVKTVSSSINIKDILDLEFNVSKTDFNPDGDARFKCIWYNSEKMQNNQFFCSVNSRPIKIQALSSRIYTALRRENYKLPNIMILNIEIPNDWVDVNLDSMKSTCIIRESSKLFTWITEIILKTINNETSVMSIFKDTQSTLLDSIKKKSNQVDSTNRIQNMIENIDSTNRIKNMIENIDSADKIQNIVENIDPVDKIQNIVENIDPVDKIQNIIENIDPIDKIQNIVENLDSADKLQNIVENLDSPNKLQNIVKNIDPVEKHQNLIEDVDSADKIQNMVENVNPADKIQNNENLLIKNTNLNSSVIEKINLLSQDEFKLFKISKDDFLNFRIIGQFNLGFILATLDSGPSEGLYILDQHACDEKYNFELYKKDLFNKPKIQTLIKAINLKLLPHEELRIYNQIDNFEKLGIFLKYQPENLESKRICVHSVSSSIKVSIDEKMIRETLDIIESGIGSFEKVVADKYLASLACRTSVMIGTQLDIKEMEKIVFSMKELDNPWTCPHGRPTIRRLCSFKSLN